MIFNAKMSSFLQAYTDTYPETWDGQIFPSCSNKRNPEGTHQQPDQRPKSWVLFGLPVSKLLMVHLERFTQIQAVGLPTYLLLGQTYSPHFHYLGSP